MTARRAGREPYPTKVCPRCGSELYEDMTVCYGCLYDFSRDRDRSAELPPCPSGLGDVGPAGAEPEVVPPGGAAPGGDTVDLSAAARHASSLARETGVYLRTGLVDAWVPVGEGGLVVGRDPACDVVLHSPAVSRRHLRLVPVADGMGVTDLGSTNPATYRGREVRGSVVVPYGDSLEVCGCLLSVTGPPGRPD